VAQTIACANQKGGVGKTTTVVNLGSYLALAGERVLVIDLDPQGNATSGLGCDRRHLDRSIYDAVIESIALDRLMVETVVPGLCLVPSTIALAGAEVELAPLEQRERRLARLLEPVRDSFDYILIDCPPSLGLLTLNALTAADRVLVALQSEYYALEGLSQLMATINLVRDHLNPHLELDGVVLTMVDARTKLSSDVAREARRHLGDRVFATTIPRNVRLSEAPSHGLPIHRYRPESPGAIAYRALAAEMRARDAAHLSAAKALDRPLIGVMANANELAASMNGARPAGSTGSTGSTGTVSPPAFDDVRQPAANPAADAAPRKVAEPFAEPFAEPVGGPR
jgi:chromosome partitioning protein